MRSGFICDRRTHECVTAFSKLNIRRGYRRILGGMNLPG